MAGSVCQSSSVIMADSTLANTSAHSLTFVYYVSGHGFGHATRVVEVTRHLIDAGHTVHIATAAPHSIWLAEIDSLRLHFRRCLLDSGAIQSDALTVNRMESLRTYEALFERQEETVQGEVGFLQSVCADLVVVDIAPMACTAARLAGVRCVVCTNFTWDFIYAEYVETQGQRFRVLCEEIANDYAQADLLLRLPGCTPMPAFRRVEDVPLVVRMARTPRETIRARHGIPADAKVCIYNFGGQPTGWQLREDFLPPGWVCLVCTALKMPLLPPNFIKPPADAYTPDLIDAADVMLGKVGYGTVSEAVAHDKPFVFIRRDYFNEQPFLLKLLSSHGLAHELRRDEFYAGRWAEKLEIALGRGAPSSSPRPSPTPRRADCRGGEVVARVLEREAQQQGGAAGPLALRDGASAAAPSAQKSHVVSGYLLRRPPARRGTSAVPRWTWSDADGVSAEGAQAGSPQPAARAAGGVSADAAVLESAAVLEPAEAFAGFALVECPPAYAAAAETGRGGGGGGGGGGDGGGGDGGGGDGGGDPMPGPPLLPDVLEFVQLLGGLRSDEARLASAGRAPDIVEAAHTFSWPAGGGAAPAGADFFVARAPGRLDLMGGISDYSGSLVLQMPTREACLVAVQRTAAPAGGAEAARLRIVSLNAELNDRGPVFQMPMAGLLGEAGGGEGAPLSYAAAHARFRADPSTSWAAYVAGCLLVLAREKGVRFGRGGLSVLVRSAVPEGKGVSSSASVEVATMMALTRCFAAEVSAALGEAARGGAEKGASIGGRELGLLAQMVENHVVGAPCGVMDQMAVLLGQQHKLLALLCQPAEVLAHVPIPSSLAVWGIDSGIRHAVSGADYGSVRVGAFMGFRLLEREHRRTRQAARRAEAEDEVEEEEEAVAAGGGGGGGETETASEAEGAVGARGGRRPIGGGHLANISPSVLEGMGALPERMGGAEFLAAFPEGHGDEVTRVEPGASYAVRQPTRHPIYEHFRVKAFAEGLHGAPVATGPFGRQVEMLGELMYQSHASYSACGLGSEGTDRIVELVRRGGISSGLFGAKITGGGSGGTVAVLGHVGSGDAIDEVAARYTREFGHRPYIFTGSSPGALAFGHLRLRAV